MKIKYKYYQFNFVFLFIIGFVNGQQTGSPSFSGNFSSYNQVIDFKKMLTFNKINVRISAEKKFLFSKWDNKGIINDKFKIQSLNYSVYDDALAYKMSEDSIFLFDKSKVDKFIISTTLFERHYMGTELGSYYLQSIYKSNSLDISLLKHYYLQEIKKKADPLMLSQQNVEYKSEYEYYINQSIGYPSKIRLRKKDILPYFKKYEKQLLDYVSSNNLSFSKENDVVKMFVYLETLK